MTSSKTTPKTQDSSAFTDMLARLRQLAQNAPTSVPIKQKIVQQSPTHLRLITAVNEIRTGEANALASKPLDTMACRLFIEEQLNGNSEESSLDKELFLSLIR